MSNRWVLRTLMSGVIALVATTGAIAAGGSPVAADANEGVTATDAAFQGRVSAGRYHSCALGDDGGVQCWGNNEYGQLGSATNSGTLTPTPAPQAAVDLGAGRTAIAIAAGEFHTCALLDDRSVRCWGNNSSGQLGSATNSGTLDPNPTAQPAVDFGGRSARAISAGLGHTCALLDDSSIRCWGNNLSGQLGSATNNGSGSPNVTPEPAVELGTGAIDVAAGDEHTCALLDNGTVRCWGNNFSGQLGSTTNNNSTAANPTPEGAVDIGAGRIARAVSAGGTHNCAVLDDGGVVCWGSNRYGQLGASTNSGNFTPNPAAQPAVDLGAGRTVAAITSGLYHSCAQLDDGTARCWGINDGGQLGAATNAGTIDPNPTAQPAVDVGAGRSVDAITAGFNHTCALLDDGTVRCWGNNRDGQLGTATNNGTTNANTAPEAAVTIASLTPVAVSDTFTSFAPVRLVDTRSIGETIDGLFQGDGAIVGDAVYEVQIGGRGSVDSDAAAAVLNLSTVNAVGNGFLTIYDCDERPLASGINYAAGSVVNNEIITKLSPTGTICIYAKTTTDLVIDAVGQTSPGSAYVARTPARLADTRAIGETIDTQFQGDGAIAADAVYEVQIAGRGGLSANPGAAVLNLSTVGSAGNGFLTIYDCGTRPLASGINYAAGRVVNNEIITKLSPTGTICIYAKTTTDLVIDAVGEIPAGSEYDATTPARLADTRATAETVDGQFQGDGAVVTDAVYEVQIAGRGGIPADAVAAVLNLSTVDSIGNGFLTVFDCGAQPLASGINYGAGRVVNNEIIVKLSDRGTICVYAKTTTHLVIDAVGAPG